MDSHSHIIKLALIEFLSYLDLKSYASKNLPTTQSRLVSSKQVVALM